MESISFGQMNHYFSVLCRLEFSSMSICFLLEVQADLTCSPLICFMVELWQLDFSHFTEFEQVKSFIVKLIQMLVTSKCLANYAQY